MRASFLPFSPPSIGEEEINEVVDSLRSGWITTGPKVKRFEAEFQAFIGSPSALALSSCTAALHVALLVSGVGPGDAVVTTPMTFCSSVHVIEQIGARPILVDVEPDTLNIDPEKIWQAINARKQVNGGRGHGDIKAILPVHLYGHPCELSAIREIASRYDLTVIEDAAHALPAKYKTRLIGSFSEGPRVLTCFSFYATKNLTTAEGGMLTGPADLLDEGRIWSLHGMSRDSWQRYSETGSWYYEVVRPGFKYNLTDIQAGLGLQQLLKLPAFQARRRTVVLRYNAAFAEFEELQTPIERPDVEHAWHLYVLRLNLERLNLGRAEFIEQLRERNIGASVHFIPVHLHPYYRDKYGYEPTDFPVASREYERILSLPLNPSLSDDDVDDVIEAVRSVVHKFSKSRRA